MPIPAGELGLKRSTTFVDHQPNTTSSGSNFSRTCPHRGVEIETHPSRCMRRSSRFSQNHLSHVPFPVGKLGLKLNGLLLQHPQVQLGRQNHFSHIPVPVRIVGIETLFPSQGQSRCCKLSSESPFPRTRPSKGSWD
jgi:hypothetical protein